MRSRVAVLRAVSAAAVLPVSLVGLAPAEASVQPAVRVHWGRPEQVPGLAALNTGYYADVTSISCWGPGGCAAGGFYSDKQGRGQAFVVQERQGRWGRATEVPGTAALNKGNAGVAHVSCAPTSVCVAVGTYQDAAGSNQWFTVAERNRRWAAAARVQQPALDGAAINTVWCAAGGLCAAGGQFKDSNGVKQAWVETETHGHWQPALEVPGVAALNVGSYADVNSVTCTSAGNCTAGGQYADSMSTVTFPFLEPFVATETNGTWGSAQEVPGIDALNAPNDADGNVTGITCPSAGNCTAVGYFSGPYSDYCGLQQPDPPSITCGGDFLVNERHGTWGHPVRSFSYVNSLTCPAAGDCVAGGVQITDAEQDSAGGLVSETNDHWGRALELANASIYAVSCASPRYCVAGGSNATGGVLVMTQSRGKWGKPVTPPGMPVRPNPDSYGTWVSAVACPPGIDRCVAGGLYDGPKDGRKAFLVSQTG